MSRIRRPTRRDVVVLLTAATLIVALVLVVVHRSARSPASLDEARSILSRSATVSILGDSTGNDDNEWVNLWATRLGGDHQVIVHQWLKGAYRPKPLVHGSTGRPLELWNASEPGGTAKWPVDRLDVAQPKRPDLVLLSFGHNNTSANIGPQLDQLTASITRRWGQVPTALVLQNPGRGSHRLRQSGTLEAASLWANAHQVPTIDVTAGFTRPDQQLADDIHPNVEGSRLWADTVADLLD